MNKFKGLLVAMLVAVLFSGCTKDKENISVFMHDDCGSAQFIKSLVIYDADRQNSAQLLVGSNDSTYLKLWTEQNFELIPIKYGECTKDVLDARFKATNLGSGKAVVAQESSDDPQLQLYTKFECKYLQDDVEKVVLYEKLPDMGETAWTYLTHYSKTLQPNDSITCFVYGVNSDVSGYYGLEMRTSENDGWSTVVSEWRQVEYGKSYVHGLRNAYQMKARKKVYGATESVVILFD